MPAYEETGLVYRTKVLKELRQQLRERSKHGRWPKIKAVLDSVTLGERSDIVMIRRIGPGVEELGVVGYREILGKVPRVIIRPRLMMQITARENEDIGIESDCLNEAVSRIIEFRAAVTATACERLEIELSGRQDLCDLMISSIKAIGHLSSGIPLCVNGEIVYGGLGELLADGIDDQVEGVPRLFTSVRAAYDWEDRPLTEDENALLSGLRYAGPFAGLDDLDASERWTEIFFGEMRDRPSHYARCTLRATNDVKEMEQALTASASNPLALVGLPFMMKDAASGLANATSVWKDDRSLSAYTFTTKGIDLRILDDGFCEISYTCMPNFTAASTIDVAAGAEFVAPAIGRQTALDIISLVERAKESFARVKMNVLIIPMMSLGDEIGDIILDVVYDEVMGIEGKLPDGVVFGKVWGRSAGRETIKKARSLPLGHLLPSE